LVFFVKLDKLGVRAEFSGDLTGKIIGFPSGANEIRVEGRHMKKAGVQVSGKVADGLCGKPILVDMVGIGEAPIYAPDARQGGQGEDKDQAGMFY
jgi:hypothetical protein